MDPVVAVLQHRPAARGARVRAVTLVGGLVALAGFLVLGYLLYFSQFSGTVRWILGIALLAIVSAIAWGQVSLRAREPAPLVREPARKVLREGELRDLADAVRRAEEGLEYSQMVVAQRAQDAFAERVRLAHGLSAEQMREIQRDAGRLRALIEDPILGDFLRLDGGDRDDRYRWVRAARRGEGFGVAFQDVLERMGAWR